MNQIVTKFNSKSQRRELRRDARRYLGTSSDLAPHGTGVFRALSAIAGIVALATNGSYKVFVFSNESGVYMTPQQANAEARERGFASDF